MGITTVFEEGPLRDFTEGPLRERNAFAAEKTDSLRWKKISGLKRYSGWERLPAWAINPTDQAGKWYGRYHPQPEWDSESSYGVDEVVYYTGRAWVCISAVNETNGGVGVDPVSDNGEHWVVFDDVMALYNTVWDRFWPRGSNIYAHERYTHIKTTLSTPDILFDPDTGLVSDISQTREWTFEYWIDRYSGHVRKLKTTSTYVNSDLDINGTEMTIELDNSTGEISVTPEGARTIPDMDLVYGPIPPESGSVLSQGQITVTPVDEWLICRDYGGLQRNQIEYVSQFHWDTDTLSEDVEWRTVMTMDDDEDPELSPYYIVDALTDARTLSHHISFNTEHEVTMLDGSKETHAQPWNTHRICVWGGSGLTQSDGWSTNIYGYQLDLDCYPYPVSKERVLEMLNERFPLEGQDRFWRVEVFESNPVDPDPATWSGCVERLIFGGVEYTSLNDAPLAWFYGGQCPYLLVSRLQVDSSAALDHKVVQWEEMQEGSTEVTPPITAEDVFDWGTETATSDPEVATESVARWPSGVTEIDEDVSSPAVIGYDWGTATVKQSTGTPAASTKASTSRKVSDSTWKVSQ